MRNESEDLSSFQEVVNVKLFFSGAQRRKILEETKKAIFNDISVVTITGDEGAGKTMICRMVEKELPPDYSCAYLANTPESFDDVVHVLARILGTENSQNLESSKELVAEIAKYLEDNDHHLVAILDQSERMYLAILERIRKMLDQINSKKVLFHVILVGRKALIENLKQLAICNFESVEEKSFSLNPLGLSETYAYLNSSVHQRSSSGKNIFTPEAAKKIYTLAQGNFRLTNMLAEKSLESSGPDTSFMVLLENVHDDGSAVAKPKYKEKLFEFISVRYNWFAGAAVLVLVVAGSLYFSGDDTKDDALVKGKEIRKEIVAVATKKEIPDNKQVLPAEEKTAPKIPEKEIEKVVVKQEKTETPLNSKNHPGGDVAVDLPEEVADTSTEVQEEPVSPKNEGQQVIGDVKKTLINEENEETTGEREVLAPVEKVTVIGEEIVSAEAQQVEETESDIETESDAVAERPSPENPPETKVVVEAIEVVAIPVNIEAEKSVEEKMPPAVPVVVEEKTEIVEKPVAVAVIEENEAQPVEVPVIAPARVEQNDGHDIDVLAVESEELVSPETSEEEMVAISESSKRKPPQQNTETGAKKIVRIAPATVKLEESGVMYDSEKQEELGNTDQLYHQRVKATSKWISGNRNDRHTVQIMVLTSEQAEGNLKTRFEQEEYREIAEDLYVIKNTNDSSVFVFYGEYADPDSARKARNTLPIFLRKHNPYVISVENAVTKATSQ